MFEQWPVHQNTEGSETSERGKRGVKLIVSSSDAPRKSSCSVRRGFARFWYPAPLSSPAEAWCALMIVLPMSGFSYPHPNSARKRGYWHAPPHESTVGMSMRPVISASLVLIDFLQPFGAFIRVARARALGRLRRSGHRPAPGKLRGGERSPPREGGRTGPRLFYSNFSLSS